MEDSFKEQLNEQTEIKFSQKDLFDKVQNFHKKNYRFRKGIVFVGNSRVGKSTIAALISGIRLKKILEETQVKIEPIQQLHLSNENLIKHSFTSVTQYPNVHQITIGDEEYSIVDLPGFKDTSYFKELCNWYYIKSILQKMDEIIFVMVVQIHNRRKLLKEKDIQMMKRFMEAFPVNKQATSNSKENLVTIVNFIELSEKQKIQNVKQEIINKLSQSLKTEQMNTFYAKSFSEQKLFLYERASYKNEDQKEKYKDGVEVDNPRQILGFIQKNLKYKQKTKQLQFKISNTGQNNLKAKNLRKIIVETSSSICKDNSELCEQLKMFFSQILDKIKDTDGTILYEDDADILTKLIQKKQLSSLEHIDLDQQIFKYSDNLQSAQVVLQIVNHFRQISQCAEFSGMKVGQKLVFIQKNISKFIQLLFNLCQTVFDKNTFRKISKSLKSVWKSIYIRLKIWDFLNNSVKDFQTNQEEGQDALLFTNRIIDQIDTLNRQVENVEKFHKSLNDYLSAQLNRMQSMQGEKVKSLSLQIVNKIKQISKIMRYDDLKTKSSTFSYILAHKRILNFGFQQASQHFSAGLLNLKQLWDKQQFKKWVQNQASEDWINIKLETFLEMIRFLSKNIKGIQDLQTVVKGYMLLNAAHFEFYELLRGMFLNQKHCSIRSQLLFQVYMQVGRHFQQNSKREFGIGCYEMAANLIFLRDMKKFQEANLKSAKLNANSNLKNYKWQNRLKNQKFQQFLNAAAEKIIMKQKKLFQNKKGIESPPKQCLNSSSSAQSSPTNSEKKNSRVPVYRPYPDYKEQKSPKDKEQKSPKNQVKKNQRVPVYRHFTG